MLNKRKSMKEQIADVFMGKKEEAPKPEDALEEEVIFTPMVETTGIDDPNLSPEEQRLKEAQAELERVIAQDGSLDEQSHSAEIEEARRVMEEAQAKVQKAQADKEARFHEANRKVLEAQADIKLAAQQKAEYEAVSRALANFKSTDAGKNIPDDTALVLCLLLEISPNPYNPSQPIEQIGKIAERIGMYHAYKRRMKIK